MAWLTNTAAFTIQERYREYSKALTTYAPKLPWIASKAKKWKKKEVVENTKDIVQFWKALDAKEQKAKAKKELEEKLARAGTEEKEEVDGEDNEWDYDEAFDDQGAEDVEEDSLVFDDPLQIQDDVYAFSPGADQKPGGGEGVRYSSNHKTIAKRPGMFVRGTTEWTRHRAAQEAATKGLGTSASPSPAPFDGASPAPSIVPYRLYRSPTPEVPGPVNRSTLITYGQNPEATRAQLAPTTSAKVKASRGDTRLNKLLWEKSAHEIDDDELFDEGELESYLRTEEEANMIRRLPHHTEMIRVATEHELKPKQPIRPRRRVRGQLNPEYLDLQKEAASKGVGMNAILKTRMKRERGEESDGEDAPAARGFRPRKKKTKVNAEAKAKLEALLAKGSDDEGDEQEECGWVGAAIDVAEQVDSELVDLGGVGIEDGEDYFEEPMDDGQDWRKEFSYGEVLSDGYDDE
jgi:hypothetical protein